MSDANVQTPSITSFRNRIRLILEREANAAHSRHIVILGIDGIPYNLALQAWRFANTTKMKSVFPTTSSAAWLSSLSGMSVASHGVPGAIFRVPERGGDLINVFKYKSPISNLRIENIFSDGLRLGYVPLAILGDLEDFDCSWRDLLLRYSLKINGYRFYAARSERDCGVDSISLCRHMQQAILQSLEVHSHGSPCLLWCFIDADRYIHRHGYDEHVFRFLELIEQAVVELTQRNVIVVAHSDHGLSRTRHDLGIENLVDQLKIVYRCSLGGAGRTKWIYPRPGTDRKIIDELVRYLPSSISINHADDLFGKGSLSRSRVGEIVLIAQGEEFLMLSGYSFDHGSLTDSEVDVPFSEWQL